MATTATNKQPLLIDRVFHNAIPTNSLVSGSASSLDIVGTNESSPLVDCTSNDGAVVEDLYVISRTATGTAYTALFYLSASLDYLRPTEAVYVGSIEASTTPGVRTSSSELPNVLAPVPRVGVEPQLKAFYVPKGKALWVTLQGGSSPNSNDAPIAGAQGGFY